MKSDSIFKLNEYIILFQQCNNVCFWNETKIRSGAAKDSDLMPGLPSTKASSALYFQSKPCSHHYCFSLPSFRHFCFFSRFPNHKTGGCWLAGSRPGLLSQCRVCCSPSFPLFTPSNASAISLLEICLSWHYRILLYFVRQACLHKRLQKRDWLR